MEGCCWRSRFKSRILWFTAQIPMGKLSLRRFIAILRDPMISSQNMGFHLFAITVHKARNQELSTQPREFRCGTCFSPWITFILRGHTNANQDLSLAQGKEKCCFRGLNNTKALRETETRIKVVQWLHETVIIVNISNE